MEGFEKPRTKSLLEHFSEVEDFATHERRVTQSLLLAVRSHWQIENALHWVLAVTFKDDLSRVRKGHGAKKYGHRPPLRPQPCPQRQRQKRPQSPKKVSQLEPQLPRLSPR
jgi:hypothetical protein